MRVLVACESSGEVREAFRRRGHFAVSCDLLPADDGSKWHYQGDVREILHHPWDLLIGHPECTYMTNSGVRHLHKDPSRWDKLYAATDFFLELWNCGIPKKCLENPIMHKYARKRIGVKYSQIIQPWMFGHPEQKATCLWLDGLPPLVETDNVKEEMMQLPANVRQRLYHLPPSKDRWKLRSKTFRGIADAMAEQWG